MVTSDSDDDVIPLSEDEIPKDLRKVTNRDNPFELSSDDDNDDVHDRDDDHHRYDSWSSRDSSSTATDQGANHLGIHSNAWDATEASIAQTRRDINGESVGWSQVELVFILKGANLHDSSYCCSTCEPDRAATETATTTTALDCRTES